jgi:hypothetical protein
MDWGVNGELRYYIKEDIFVPLLKVLRETD